MLRKVPTGCKSIDRILSGGLHSGSVSLLYGEAETGKTSLAIQCAANCAESGYKTLFVDCDGTFSAQRFSQISKNIFKNSSRFSQLILLIKPTSFSEQKAVIDKLSDFLKVNVGLIVIDSVTSLYQNEIAKDSEQAFEINRELNRELAVLAQVAKAQGICILVTSQMKSSPSELLNSIEPVATRVLNYWANTIMSTHLSTAPHLIELKFHKILGKNQELFCQYKISGTGIKEYPQGL